MWHSPKQPTINEELCESVMASPSNPPELVNRQQQSTEHRATIIMGSSPQPAAHTAVFGADNSPAPQSMSNNNGGSALVYDSPPRETHKSNANESLGSSEKKKKRVEDDSYVAVSDDTTTSCSRCPQGIKKGWNAYTSWLTHSVVKVPASSHVTLESMLGVLVKNAGPVSLSSIFKFAVQHTTLMFVGQFLDSETMAQFVVGISLFNVLGFSIAFGFAVALDTLGSQAFGRNPHSGAELSLLTQRALLLCLLLCVPIAMIFAFLTPLLTLCFGDIGTGAGAFLQYMIPSLFFNTVSAVFQRALQAQNESRLPAIAQGLTFLCAIPLNMGLTQFGLAGAAGTLICCNFILMTITMLFAFLHPASLLRVRNAAGAQWWPIRAKVYNWAGVKEFLSIGFNSMTAVCAEWWAFEVLNLTVVHFGADVTDALNIAYNISIIMWSTSGSGAGTAAAVACGNALGAGDADLAKAYARLSAVYVVHMIALNITVVGCFSDFIFKLYTSDVNVQALLKGNLPFLLLYHLGDGLQFDLQGIFRGVGRQKTSARLTVFALWVVGLPVSVLCSSVANWGLPGAFGGFTGGLVLLVPLLLLFYKRWDWGVLLAEAQFRAEGLKDDEVEMKEHQNPTDHNT